MNWLSNNAFVGEENIKAKENGFKNCLSQIFVFMMTGQIIPDEMKLLKDAGFEI